MQKRKKNVIDKSDIVTAMVQELSKKGAVRLVHFGQFTVRTIRGHKRYDFRKRAIIAAKPYKIITFKPAKGIQEMLKSGKMASE